MLHFLWACVFLQVHIRVFFYPNVKFVCVSVSACGKCCDCPFSIQIPLQQRFSDLLPLTTCCEAVTCLQHLISVLWCLRYQMDVSKQHPCSPLSSTVLACSWRHVGGKGGVRVTVVFFKLDIKRTTGAERKKESSLVHLGELFKVDTIRVTERSGLAVQQTTWSQNVTLRPIRLNEAKVRNLRRNEKDKEGWREKEMEGVRKCMSARDCFFFCVLISFTEDK